ncbi:MAG: 16S rRNA (cytosine(967)-C(5))-methyltransferase RsmB [Betaproteobacteria bacterium]|nr:16S rRNA (cytosine(967)-C(5))-methyltransferase RsmB [Betaproteobacteria bacterium]
MVAVQASSADVVGRALAGENLDRVLDQLTSASTSLGPNERSAVHSIAFDTLRHYGLLSAQLDTLLTQPISDAAVRHLLLIALAQLQFSKAAAHAIVDHAVSAAEQMGYSRAKSLVNAVLRNFLRAPEKFSRQRFKLEVARYDFPRWWIKRMKLEYPNRWEPALLSARERPPMWLRVNQRYGTAVEYLTKLVDAGLPAEWHSGQAIRLEKPVPVHDLPCFREGHVSVQDLGAQQSAILLGAESGMRVLDACAAPGGKACHLLECANLDLLALDSDARRLTRVADNLERLGLRAHLKAADAARPADWWDGNTFDRILLDVPCSGSGVVRRHPDIKWGRREADLARFAQQQSQLLDALWNCLGNGGRLLYATCSVFSIENSGIVEQFLRKTPNARALALPDFPLVPVAANAGVPASLGCQLLPDHAHDGFYYALLEKVE